jgi:hypothetical protein
MDSSRTIPRHRFWEEAFLRAAKKLQESSRPLISAILVYPRSGVAGVQGRRYEGFEFGITSRDPCQKRVVIKANHIEQGRHWELISARFDTMDIALTGFRRQLGVLEPAW